MRNNFGEEFPPGDIILLRGKIDSFTRDIVVSCASEVMASSSAHVAVSIAADAITCSVLMCYSKLPKEFHQCPPY